MNSTTGISTLSTSCPLFLRHEIILFNLMPLIETNTHYRRRVELVIKNRISNTCKGKQLSFVTRVPRCLLVEPHSTVLMAFLQGSTTSCFILDWRPLDDVDPGITFLHLLKNH